MKMIRQHFLLIGLPCLLSVACAPQLPEKINAVRDYNATFVCDGNQSVLVHFTPFKAVLESQGASTEMTQQPAADGFLYTAEKQSLRARGDEATWTDGTGTVHHCRDAVAASPKR